MLSLCLFTGPGVAAVPVVTVTVLLPWCSGQHTPPYQVGRSDLPQKESYHILLSAFMSKYHQAFPKRKLFLGWLERETKVKPLIVRAAHLEMTLQVLDQGGSLMVGTPHGFLSHQDLMMAGFSIGLKDTIGQMLIGLPIGKEHFSPSDPVIYIYIHIYIYSQ